MDARCQTKDEEQRTKDEGQVMLRATTGFRGGQVMRSFAVQRDTSERPNSSEQDICNATCSGSVPEHKAVTRVPFVKEDWFFQPVGGESGGLSR